MYLRSMIKDMKESVFVDGIKKLYGENIVIYGPYERKSDKRQIICLYDGFKRPAYLYAKLKLEVHLGRKLKDDETVDHKNDNPFDDHLNNLQILSRSDNIKKAIKHGIIDSEKIIKYGKSEKGKKERKNKVIGEKNPLSLFKDDEIVELRNAFVNKNITIEEICQKYKATRRAIKNMLSGISYSHLGGILTPKIKYGTK